MTGLELSDAIRLFSEYLRATGVAHLGPERHGDPGLVGKRLGLVNGSSWITLWANYSGRLYLPGVHLVNMGNEATQLNFMEAYRQGLLCPPRLNIDAFVRYARDLVELAHVDAVLITCSTMNRAYPELQAALAPQGVPVIQIDQPMMEQAVAYGGTVLVVATHGPSVRSTQALLEETAVRYRQGVKLAGLTVDTAWECLGIGDVRGHNEVLAEAIRASLRQEAVDSVVLAQLSMAVILFSVPDPTAEFGVPVLISAQSGFGRVREVLKSLPERKGD